MPPINVLLTGLPTTPSLCLRVADSDQPLPQPSLVAAVTAATGLPSASFYLRRAGALLTESSFITRPGQHTVFVELFLRRALPGGKGGFGATLKGSSATKVTTNFDACRDLHGRRLKDVRNEAAIAEYLRNHGPPNAHREEPTKKRPRTPEPQHQDTVTKVDTDELDDTIDTVNRDVEDAVAAGLRAAAEQRKRQRVPHSRGSGVQAVTVGLVHDSEGMSDPDSDGSEADVVLKKQQGSSLRTK